MGHGTHTEVGHGTHTVMLPKIVVFTTSLKYWIVNLLLVVKEFSAALVAVIEARTHQHAKAKQGEESLKSRVHLGIPTLKKY